MVISAILGMSTLPSENANSDVPGKYSNTHFRIERNGYDGSGRNHWPEHVKVTYEDEVKTIFMSRGWVITEPRSSGSAASAEKGRSNLYLHPQDFSGVCENAERVRLLAALLTAGTFICTKVDVYEEIHDMSDEQLVNLLENKREVIETELLEAFTTKRRNLLYTDIGFFGVDGKVAKRHSVKRLAIDGEKSFGGKDDRSDGICHKFVSDIFNELVSVGKIVTSQTKHGLGYRTAKKGERAKT